MNANPIFTDSRGRKFKEPKIAVPLNQWTPTRIVAMLIIFALVAGGGIGASTLLDLSAAGNQVKGILPVANGGYGGNTLTAHGPLLGEGTSPVVAAAAGTSGQPFLSGGSSADGAFGNLAVGAGGTGDTTLAAHGVVIGNGTSGLNVTSPGTATQCFISNGASSDPTFQACPTAPTFVYNETPSGTINASNGTFTLANAPNPSSSLICYLNGLEEAAGGVDFTLSTLTLTYGTAPNTGSSLRCNYTH